MATQIPARLGFVVITNHDMPLINTALFETSSGETVTVDRDTTEWSVEEIEGGFYRMEMVWRCCYLWDGNGTETYMEWRYPFDHGFEFVGFEIEHEAPEDYFVNAELVGWFNWGFCDDQNV